MKLLPGRGPNVLSSCSSNDSSPATSYTAALQYCLTLKEHAPESFVVWAAANKARVENDADRTRVVREPVHEVCEPEMREPRNVRDPELTLDIPRGRARQLDESEQPEKIDDEPKQETPDDAGRMPAIAHDEPEIDGPDHEFGFHL